MSLLSIDDIQSFKPQTYPRVRRGEDTHIESRILVEAEINRLLESYHALQESNHSHGERQKLRLLRDAIDHWLRRYQGYVIQGGVGSHYVEVGASGKRIFEHVIPARDALDMLIQRKLTVVQAMNIPTCLISKDNDNKLRQAGLVKTNSDPWKFFKRYDALKTNFSLYDGTQIDPDYWTLAHHYQHFAKFSFLPSIVNSSN